MKTVKSLAQMKQNKEKIVMMTAYDYPSAVLCEQAGMDLILVGDSLGMVVLGYETTIPVTVDEMIYHTKTVRRGAASTFVVTDMPFMSYHGSIDTTLDNARRIMQESGASAVKLEGGGKIAETVKRLTDSGVPVMGHLGLTPQSVGVEGGYKVHGKQRKEAEALIEDAKKLEQSGAFAIVLECVPQQLAEIASEALQIPVIGIGAGAGADGQVLVYHDIVGYGSHHVPKFVKKYGEISPVILDALTSYKQEVKNGTFPAQEHSFTMKEEELPTLYGGKER
ncbi:3-methyl-2-oxobutanoate hydroxymethyltransferase [Fictibacillus iocasae]|uniref:3-methyl-2-oxobutanoate hydroxymethyltransferase n=1 Tax=Fictibacillus iocasae TaxID=2715437 RepID=A0ABW2NIN6_9BACL